jgi:hypothetical protein
MKTPSSNGVRSLKCEASPRQACIAISAVSPTLEIANTIASGQPTSGRRGRNVMIQAMVALSAANENENSIGFRHESGPSHARSPRRNTTPCTAAPARNAGASQYRNRWYGAACRQ